MQNNFPKIFTQINKQIDSKNTVIPIGVNPSNAGATSFTSAAAYTTSSVQVSNINFTWTVKQIQNSQYTDLSNIPSILSCTTNTSFYTVTSSDTNISIPSAKPNTIYIYNAILYRNTTNATASLSFSSNEEIRIFVNNNEIFYSANNNSNTTNIQLSVGANDIQIFIYNGTQQNVSISDNLSNYADSWLVPDATLSSVPQNLTAAVDPHSSSAGINITNVKWSSNTDGNTLGYNIYRRGPYNYLSNTISSLSSSYATSGVLNTISGTTYLYEISAINQNGETLPSNLITQSLYPTDPVLSNYSISQNNTYSIMTGNNYYAYNFFGSNQETKYYIMGSTPGKNLQTLIQSNIAFADIQSIYGWAPWGINIFRSTSPSFAAGSLIGKITTPNTTVFVDDGTFNQAPYKLYYSFNGTLQDQSINKGLLSSSFVMTTGELGITPYINSYMLKPIPSGLSYAVTEPSALSGPDNSFSIEAYVYLMDSGTSRVNNIFFDYCSGSQQYLQFYTLGSKLEFYGYGTTNLISNQTLGSGWNHIAFSYNGPGQFGQFYINNSSAGSGAISINPLFGSNANTPYFIGNSDTPSQNSQFSGYLQNLIISKYYKTKFYNDGSTLFQGNGINLTWTGVSGATGYNIYRSNTQIFQANSLIYTNFTGTYFWDSGYIATTGVPTIFKNYASIIHPTSRYDDVGVKFEQMYDYQVTSYNSILNESAPSSSVSIIAGDNIPPNTPSGISGVSSDAFITLSWENGIEPDLYGTYIYYSPTQNGSYQLVGNTASTTWTMRAGYNTTAYFELANYDWVGNTSPFSSVVSGTTGGQPLTSGSISGVNTYQWNISVSNNPINTGYQTITIVSPYPVAGTPNILVKQNGQSMYSNVLPIYGTSPVFSGTYTIVGGFPDGQALVSASGTSTNGNSIIGTSSFIIDTTAPQNVYLNFKG